MKKNFFIYLMAVLIFIPCALLLSACGGGKNNTPEVSEEGISVYIDGAEVNEQFNTIEVCYEDYANIVDLINNKISVEVNYNNETSKSLVYGNDGFIISGLPQNLNANEQGYNLTLSYKNYSKELILVIHKKNIDFSSVGWSYDGSYPFIYDGEEKTIELVGIPDNVEVTYENNKATNAGTYNASATVEYDKNNYNITNDEHLVLTQQWSINKAQIDMGSVKWDYSATQPFTYDGTEQEVKLINLPEGIGVNYENNTETNAGTYTARVTLNYNTTNYELININFIETINWTINKQQVIKPNKVSGISYNGQEQTGVNYNSEYVNILFTVRGDTVATNAGQYSVTFALIDTDNYQWDDGSINNIVLDWRIEQAPLYVGGVSWDYNTYEPFTYDGQEKTVSIINLPKGVTVKNYTGTISATDAGTYTAGVVFEYDDVNYYLSGEPQELQWKIEKAENTISGELVLKGITYGDTLGEPSGVSAAYGDITYKYYNNEYEEISKPTNVGTYYVKGFSVGNNNWVAQETEYKQFYISRNYISDPELVRNCFIYTGTAFTPELVEEIDESIVEMTGDLSGTKTGNYTITFTLKDKTNYGWQSASGTAQETDDITLNWSIIDSPLTMTLNGESLSSSEFEALIQFNIGDNWYVTVNEGYNYSLNYEYLNTNNIKVWSGQTDEGSNSNLDVTIDPSRFTYIIKITQYAEVVYTKTITVNHDIFENVMVGDKEMTFDEFVANPEVEYGKNLKFNLKTGYESIFTFSANDFEVTENTTITIKYQLSGERVYKTIEVLCVIKPVESVTVGSQTLSYEEFIANPVVKYGDTLSIKFKSNYTGFYTDYSFPYEVKDDIQVIIYTSTDEIFDTINVKCRKNVLTDISIDGTSVSYEELLQMNSIHLGSSLTFTINEEFVNVIEVVMNNNGQDNVLTGQQTIVFEEINNLYLNIRDKYTQSSINSISLNVIFFDSIVINNNVVDTTHTTYINYSRDLNENIFTISTNDDLFNKYTLYYETNSSTKVEITQPTFEVSIEEIKEYLYIYVIYDNDVIPVLTIHFIDFCPVETVSVQVYQQNSIDNPQYYIDNDEISITSYGVINSLSLTYKDGYTDCTYKVFDENGLEIDDFTTIKNTTYTIKIYSDNTEIYSFLFKVKYQFNNLIDGMQYLGDANVASIVTNDSQLSIPNLTDTEYFTNQSIMFNGSNSVTLTEGQQTIEVVYSFTVNQKTFTYAFDLIVEYVLQEDNPIDYVSGITINYTDIWGNSYAVSFDSNLKFTNWECDLSDIAFVEENDIIIDTAYIVVSKEIKFSEDKTYCWLEYVIDVDGQNKTFRGYIKTTGTISNNTNAQIIFSDAKTEEDLTNLLVDNTYTIEKVNVFGDLEIILEDENARIEYYFNGKIVDGNNIALNPIGTYTVKIFSSGTYTVKIFSSDNTATRSINIIVQDYESLMFEAFYESERLYLEYSNNGPIGNMTMKYNPLTGPYFIGYFGEKNLTGLTQVTISGNSAYENMLYYSDKETPITNLDNLVLDIMTDLDGSITEIIGGKYVLVYAKIENVYHAIYFIFENRPPYPMTFSFDTDKNGEINENDTQISLKVNLEEAETGVVDLGDFYIGESGPSVEVTREELGMAETETTVNATVNWLSTFEDYSYQYFTDLPEGQDMPELIGPSEDNLTSTFTLNFVDDGSGQLVATIYVCSEGATQETLKELIVPVTFILVD